MTLPMITKLILVFGAACLAPRAALGAPPGSASNDGPKVAERNSVARDTATTATTEVPARNDAMLPGPAPTDRDGKAGGAGRLAAASTRDAEPLQRSVDEWDERIAQLKHGDARLESSDRRLVVAEELSHMQRQAKRDLAEWERADTAMRPDVRARLEARLDRMDREYRRLEAE